MVHQHRRHDLYLLLTRLRVHRKDLLTDLQLADRLDLPARRQRQRARRKRTPAESDSYWMSRPLSRVARREQEEGGPATQQSFSAGASTPADHGRASPFRKIYSALTTSARSQSIRWARNNPDREWSQIIGRILRNEAREIEN
jgi:hypothetical protein